jgi:hypothetical protein
VKYKLAVIIAVVSGLLMVVSFFARGTILAGITDESLRGQTIVGGIALLLGAFSIVQVHWRRIVSRHQDRMYSAILLLCLAVMALSGIFAGVDSGGVYNWLFQSIQAPMMATMFSMLAFFLASAAYRAFRARTVLATILLVTAVVVMLGRIPMGQHMVEQLPGWVNWVMMVPNIAVQRGIMIGAGLGAASLALRIILGTERSYLGRS